MGTRSGDLDPAVVFHLHRVAGLPLDEIDTCSTSTAACSAWPATTTCGRCCAGAPPATAAATLAFDVYCRRIREYVGAYLAVLGRLDAITFTAGVGENAPAVRAARAGRPGASRHRGRPGAQRGARRGRASSRRTAAPSRCAWCRPTRSGRSPPRRSQALGIPD